MERAVDGIKGTQNIHWISAYGLVDSDDRTEEQIQELLAKGIAAVPFYSVEALYYHLHIVEIIATKLSAFTGQEPAILFQRATANIIQDINQHKERLCSKLCEKRIRNEVMSNLPKHRDFQTRRSYNLSLDLSQILQAEESQFNRLVEESNLIGLLTRYPIRETQVLNRLVAGLGLTREQYESAVRKLIIDEPTIKEFYKELLQPLTSLIG